MQFPCIFLFTLTVNRLSVSPLCCFSNYLARTHLANRLRCLGPHARLPSPIPEGTPETTPRKIHSVETP